MCLPLPSIEYVRAMRATTRIGRAAVVLATCGATIIIASQPAHAQSNPYTPQEVCNTSHDGGFAVIDHANLAAQGASGIVYLLRNGRGWVCAVTIKTANVGTGSPTTVRLQRYLGPLYTDNGPWNFYAG